MSDGTVLALDLATSTGWAVRHPGERAIFGSFRLPSTGNNVGRFLHEADNRLSDLLTEYTPSLVVFEAPILPSSTNLATARKLYGLAGILELACWRREIVCRECNNSTVRKHVLGPGRPKGREQIKAALVAAVTYSGYDVRNDDEADALALLDYALATTGYPPLNVGTLVAA